MKEEEFTESPAVLVDGIYVADKPKVSVVRTDPVAVVVLLVLSLLLALGIAYVLTSDAHTRETAEAILPVATQSAETPKNTAPVNSPTPHTFARWNFQAVLPLGWHETRTTPTLPPTLSNTKHAYTKTGTSCVIAYAEFPKLANSSEYPQTTQAGAVKRGTTTVGIIHRHIPVLFASSTMEVKPSNAPYTPHEIALAYWPLYYDNGTDDTTRNVWTLFSNNETAIPGACHQDFADFITSFEPYFTQHTLNTKDTGTLYIEQRDAGTYLLFRDQKTQTAQVVATLDTGAIFKPTFTNTTLYYVGTNGTLRSYDLFENTGIDTLSITGAADASVNDFTVATSSIEYLLGTWCHTDPTTCNLTHYTFDLSTGTHTPIETSVTEPRLQNPPQTDTASSLTLTRGTLQPGPDTFEGVVIARMKFLFSGE